MGPPGGGVGMIPGGSAAQRVDAPYTYPVQEVFIDFENAVCKVAGVDADIYDLIDGLGTGDLTEAGLVVSSQLKAKGALFTTLRNILSAGGVVIVEYAPRAGGYRYGRWVNWYYDSETPDFFGVVADMGASAGAQIADYVGIAAQSGSGDYYGGISEAFVQRGAVVIGLRNPAVDGVQHVTTSLNGSSEIISAIPYRINAGRVKRIDLFGTDVFPSTVDSRWNVRKLHVLPLTFYTTDVADILPPLTDREAPISTPAGSLGRDHGGKKVYRYGPFTLSEAANANRLVVAAITHTNETDTSLSIVSVEFDGVAAECTASNGQMEIWQLVVPTGTSIDEVVVTFSQDMRFCVCKLYDFITSDPVPYDAKAGSSAVGANVTLSDLAIDDGGKVVALMKAACADSATSWTWTGPETPNTSNFNMNGTHGVSILDMTGSARNATYDLTCDAPAGATGNVYVMAVSWAPAAANDPAWSSVKLMLGFNGADGATTFTAEESSPHALTFVGNAQLDTAQAKFGSASLLLDGTGDYISALDSDDWHICGAGTKFTVECFVRQNSITGNQAVIGQWVWSTNIGWVLNLIDGKVYFTIGTAASTYTQKLISDAVISPNTWYHVRVSFDGTTYRAYVNGDEVVSATGAVTGLNAAVPLAIGMQDANSANYNGWLDEVRVTKGVARNSGLTYFMPPKAAFPRS